MKYALDTEFIDTPTCSALISLALVGEDNRHVYFEFDHPIEELTPWLQGNVVPSLHGKHTPFDVAADEIRYLISNEFFVEFWCYYGAYDWYWFCRLFGGMLNMPPRWPHRYKEFAEIQHHVPDISGVKHNALNDAVSLMAALKGSKKKN